MSTAEADELAAVLDRVRNWPPPRRIALARRILETLEAPSVSEPPRPRSVKDLVGLIKTEGPPPTDEECRNIRDEELARKYLR